MRFIRSLGLVLLFFVPVAASGSPLLTADGEAVPLARVEVEATIVGFLARTTTTLTFRNDKGQALEGQLDFPLPEGATISGYALDVDGAMVEGVAVEAQAARVAFETEERRRVDPGLVEYVRGNAFRTRVWPIPEGGTRTVRVSYVSELTTRAGGGAGVYVLPLAYDTPVDDFALRIEVMDTGTIPEIESPAFPGLRFARGRTSHVAETHQSKTRLGGDLRVSLPRVTQPHVSIEPDEHGGFVFVLDDFPQDPGPAPAPRPVRRATVLWDASLSRAKADTARERALLARWITGHPEVEIQLTVFRNVPEPARKIHVHGGDASRLLDDLAGVAYDGGTSFAGLPFADAADAILLFSDGLDTLAQALPAGAAAPVFAISSGPQVDHGVLRRLAEGSGGAYVDLSRRTDDEAMALLGTTPFALLGVTAAPGSIGDVMPAGVRPIVGRITVSGRLLVPEAVVTLRYGRGAQMTASRTFTLRRAEATRTGLVARFWAQQKAAELALDPSRRPELVALGRRFGLVTPATSLLVLETLEQHLTHQIAPPKSRPEMRAEYVRLAAEAKQARARETEDKVERLVAEWQEHLTWWRRDFRAPLPTPKPTRAPVPRPDHAELAPVPSRPCTGTGGQIHGAVVDPSGAPLPGTRVTALHQDTGVAVYVQSEADGRYRLCGLTAGTYRLTGEMSGFKSFSAQVRLGFGGVVALPFTMDVGTMTETIEVAVASDSGSEAATASIAIQEWDPDTPYLTALESVTARDAYGVYLQQRDEFGGSPAFFLDCAGFFYRSGAPDLGVRVLTSILELKLDEPRLLRVVAHRLQQANELDLAVSLFERIAALRPEEPHSPRDLALALAARADASRVSKGHDRRRAAADYARALELLNDVVLGQWDRRFEGIEMIALVEANRLIGILERERLPGARRVALDRRLRGAVDVDLRIILTWDTDGTDMDLWVTEPSGEKCSYDHNRTRQGGGSRDLTGGYGPEEYALRRAAAGAYQIEANYYGSDSAAILGPTTLQATIVTDYGRRTEKRDAVTLRLADESEVITVGTARFQPRHP